jgi:hypothetical protein
MIWFKMQVSYIKWMVSNSNNLYNSKLTHSIFFKKLLKIILNNLTSYVEIKLRQKPKQHARESIGNRKWGTWVPHYGEDQISLGTTCFGKALERPHFIWEYDMESKWGGPISLGTTC